MKMLAWAGLLLCALLACAPAHAQIYDRNQNPTALPGTVQTGSLASAGTSQPVQVRGDFNFSLWGTFSATCELDRSFDAGTTWLPLAALGTAFTWSGPTTETLTEPEYGVRYRVNCPTVASGTVNYRVSQ
jgi:hypothetical protein